MSDLATAAAEGSLQRTYYTNSSNFLEHIKDLQTKWKLAVKKGADVKDRHFWAIVIASLPESWDTIVVTIQGTATSAETIAGLMVHWECVATQAVKTRTSATALQAKLHLPSKPKLACINTNCRCTGHTIENCYWKGGEKEGQFPLNFRKRGRTAPAPTVNMVDTTTDTHTTYALAARTQSQFTPAAIYTDAMEPIDTYLANLPPANITAYHTSSANVVTYADLGASNHCFVKREDFTDYEPYPTPCKGLAANQDGVFNIMGKGAVKKTVKTNGRTADLIFRSTIHTPDLTANLISISKFDTLGHTVTFGRGRVSFTNPTGRVFLVRQLVNGMYLLEALNNPNRVNAMPQAMVTCSLDIPVDLDCWHCWLGHVGVTAISKMVRKDLVTEIHVKGDLTVKGLCEDCIYGKHAAQPYDGVTEAVYKPNDKMYVNLWGPLTVASLGGAWYLMLFADKGTGRLKGTYLSAKSAIITLTALKFHVAKQ